MSKSKDYCRDFNDCRYNIEWNVTPAEKKRVDIILRMCGSKLKILDIGCYDGTIASLLKRNGNQVTGVETSQKAVAMALAKGIDCVKLDINEGLGQFKDHAFDLVLAAEVIEHILDLSFFMREIKRVLKPGGSLVLSTPNLSSFGRRLCLLLGKNPLIEIGIEDGAAGHIRYFVRDTMVELLTSYDFKVQEYCSDVVNFDNSGKHFSALLARIFPGLGKSIIVKATNK